MNRETGYVEKTFPRPHFLSPFSLKMKNGNSNREILKAILKLSQRIGEQNQRMDKRIEAQEEMLKELKFANQELKQMMKEEKELKAFALALLKDHKLRMDMHWDEIVSRTSK